MVAHNRSLFLLKIKTSQIADEYKIIAGMQASRVKLNNQIVESSNLASGKWRSLISEVGVSSTSILANGFFKNSEYEEEIRKAVFANEEKEFLLEFNNGDSMAGKFLISNFEKQGSREGEEIYSFILESAGEILYKKSC